MFKIVIQKVVYPPKPPKPKKTAAQLKERRWNRKLTAAVLVILFFLSAHVGMDIWTQQYLEYELAICEFDARVLESNYGHALAEAKNEIEQYEIAMLEFEQFLKGLE
jgi:hypothetical protein